MFLNRMQRPWLSSLVVFVALLGGCTASFLFPDRWITEDGASLTQMRNGHYQYSKGIGAPYVTCVDGGEGVISCDDGTVSKLERLDGHQRVRFDGRMFVLGPI
jgi:hypothetical protein